MPNVTEGIAFTFDPEMFIKGIEKVTTSIQGLEEQMTKTAGSISKKMESGFAKTGKSVKSAGGIISSFGKKGGGIVNNLLMKVGALAIAFLSIRKAMQFIPEIGRTWQVVSEIFLRNFLWPLRQLLMPILQRILDWTRQNRKLFIEMGTVVAGVFKTMITIGKVFFNLLKNFWLGFTKSLSNTYDLTIKNIEKALFLFMARISMIAIYLEILLKPIFDTIGELAGGIVKNIRIFFKAFIDSIEKTGILDSVIKLGDSLGKFWDALNNLINNSPKVEKFFKTLGNVLGVVVGESLKIAVKLLNELVETITALIEIDLPKLKEKGKEALTYTPVTPGFWKEYYKDIRNIFGEKPEKISEEIEAKDVIITKTGKIIKTHPDDTIMAMKKFTPGGADISKKYDINVNIGDINLTVTEGNVVETAKRFAGTLHDELNNTLRNMFYRQLETRAAV